ncbi:hypothetical protein MSIMFI_00263 [Mycobacterium simulans]|uniref:hypothetical protein n=1 Tax=Mycobacterium simulans TaxID=627089 RepID=UPI00174BF162|nr:hypothetical protein [Mycobacterium simulans]SON58785.1 hypothetical protein MSIMFI_00263 [Mycobacterium simulans]
MSVVITRNESLAATGFSPADLETLRAINEKIATARTAPTKLADDAWLCISAVNGLT